MKDSEKVDPSKKTKLSVKKGVQIAASAAALLAIGFVPTSIQAAKSTMVNCIIRSSNGCSSSCPSPTTQVMTLEECRQEGGTPTKIEE